jgi:PAS domain S-box-containing protein
VIIKEVTERMRLEEDGRQSRELYTKIFQSSPAALVLSRIDSGQMIEVNEMFVKLSGYSRNELIGHTTTELNIWKVPGDREQLVDLARSNGFKRHMELSYRRKDGTMRICNASPQRIDLDNIHCMLSVIEDITEQLEIEERVKSNEEKFRTLFDHAGMGLAVAYSIVKAHNGHISIESDIEKGTTVHIYLPSMNQEKPAERRSEKTTILKNHLKVLVMDDEKMIRELATEMLEMLGTLPKACTEGKRHWRGMREPWPRAIHTISW